MKRFAEFFSVALIPGAVLFFLGACASDRYLSNPGHNAFDQRRFDEAAKDFAKDANTPGVNQVLFMLDEATSLVAAGKYAEAIPIYLKAEKLCEIKDYTSISEEVGTLVTSDNIRGYKGEDFEKVLINVYLALSYSALQKIEDAQVEARKINEILYRMIHEGKRNYQESPFARYLSAMLWEATGDLDSAYIDYKETYKLDPKFPDIGDDIVGLARRTRRSDELPMWNDKFPQAHPRRFEKDEGEIVFIFQQGLGPIKMPRDGQNSPLPIFIRRYSYVDSAKVFINGEVAGNTIVGLNVEATSIRYLEDRIGRMMASKIAGTAVKGALAYGVGSLTKDENLGWLTFLLLSATDKADLRSWRTLPASIQFLRIPVRAGSYDLKFQATGRDGGKLFEQDMGKVTVRAGKKVFLMAK